MRCLFVFDFVYDFFSLGRKAHRSANGVSIFLKMSIVPSNVSLISDPRRGCYIVSSMFIFFFFFFRHDFVAAISLEPSLVQTPD